MALPLGKLKKLKMPMASEKDSPALQDREEDMHQDLDNDAEEGEDSEHQAKVDLSDGDESEPGMGDEAPSEEDGSLESDNDQGDDMGEHESTHDLSEVSDDDLHAEIQKRGLEGKLNKKRPPMASKFLK